MAKSLKLNFAHEGCTFSLDETVEGFEAVAQNGMVNIATERGSDPGNPDRGTRLLKDSLEGRVADILGAQHNANLAAIDTLFFLRASDDPNTTEERVEDVAMMPVEYDGKLLHLSARFVGDAGSEVGREENI